MSGSTEDHSKALAEEMMENNITAPRSTNFENLKEVPEGSPEHYLWVLLDDIDTASDMFKPPKNNFYRYVMRKAEERSKHIISDGYKLYWREPSTLKRRTMKTESEVYVEIKGWLGEYHNPDLSIYQNIQNLKAENKQLKDQIEYYKNHIYAIAEERVIKPGVERRGK